MELRDGNYELFKGLYLCIFLIYSTLKWQYIDIILFLIWLLFDLINKNYEFIY